MSRSCATCSGTGLIDEPEDTLRIIEGDLLSLQTINDVRKNASAYNLTWSCIKRIRQVLQELADTL